ncbi:ABC transporter, ATP-binding protein (cluster 1, maltose/g3p/polyamine/iron); ABC transporter, ATP-binding protein (cluster 10, nitrate/sulfonate/bicarbonate) [hydrothermal vent metagenome]|uniref:ABC transporter, ATP-binding protein (Cluster 1, maltose/g3p/polyamine/iron) ABC transporter, ATP-binding protein (Cluster 10, nitrate/sulfonate/bicarbonate) n=1 Tax=hydrothermal vent metagenome TaxID=652676 RepID=A0A3B0U5T1_9ZZZZ
MQHSVSIKDLSLNFGAVRVLEQMNLDISQGEFLVLLGPSGCGKSTLLNCIAGLLDISDGQIFIGGRNVTWEEPKDRGIGMVFQSYALYPQMSVEKNLSFSLRVAGLKKDEIAKRVKRAAEILQIEPLLGRKPAELSGGQRQRVAIGRALVRDVEVFLFDEPLSNLDAKLRSELRVEIKRLHHRLKNTMIYVTHDQIEAMTLADRIAIMKGGVIQQLDSPGNIYNRPVNRFVASFVGSPAMNFINGKLTGGNKPQFSANGINWPLGDYQFIANPGENEATIGIRPEHISVGDEAKSMPVQIEVEVEVVEPMGSDALGWTTIGGNEISFRCASEMELKPGQKLKIGFDPARGSLFDQKTGDRL